MRLRIFSILSLFSSMFVAGLQAQTMTPIVASHLLNVDGSPVTGRLCIRPALTSGVPQDFAFGGTGQGSTAQKCFSVTAGVLQSGVSFPDTSATAPTNLCIYTQLIDPTQPMAKQLIKTWPCLQPSGSSDWSLDSVIPSAPALPVMRVTGPAGPAGVINWRGDWAATTLYHQNDGFIYGGYGYVVMNTYTSGSTFGTTSGSPEGLNAVQLTAGVSAAGLTGNPQYKTASGALGAETELYIAPSGDTSGARDNAAIESACADGQHIKLADNASYYIQTVGCGQQFVMECGVNSNIYKTTTTGDFFDIQYGGGALNTESLIGGIWRCNFFMKPGVTPTEGDLVDVQGVDDTHNMSSFHMVGNTAWGLWGGIKTGPHMVNNWFEDNLFVNFLAGGDGALFYETPSPGGDSNLLGNQFVGYNTGVTFYSCDQMIIDNLKLNFSTFLFAQTGQCNRGRIVNSSFEGDWTGTLPFNLDFGTGSHQPQGWVVANTMMSFAVHAIGHWSPGTAAISIANFSDPAAGKPVFESYGWYDPTGATAAVSINGVPGAWTFIGLGASCNTTTLTCTFTGTGAPSYQEYDSFIGTSSTSLFAHTSDLGHTWTDVSTLYGYGALGVGPAVLNGSGQLTCTLGTSGDYCTGLDSLSPSSANYVVSQTFTLSSSAGGGRVYARGSSSASTYYAVGYFAGVGYTLWKEQAGTVTLLGSNVSASWATGTPYVLSLDVSGTSTTTLVVKVNGVTVDTQTDSSPSSDLQSAGHAGFDMNGGSTTTVSNFSVL